MTQQALNIQVGGLSLPFLTWHCSGSGQVKFRLEKNHSLGEYQPALIVGRTPDVNRTRPQ